MSDITSSYPLTWCGWQGYRLRCWKGVVPLAGKGGQITANVYAVAASGPRGSDSHAQDHQSRPQIDHHAARDAPNVVRGQHGCQHRSPALCVDSELVHAVARHHPAADLRHVVCARLPASPQASSPHRNRCPAGSQDQDYLTDNYLASSLDVVYTNRYRHSCQAMTSQLGKDPRQ